MEQLAVLNAPDKSILTGKCTIPIIRREKKFLWGFSKKCSTYSLIQKRKTFMLWQLVKRYAGNKLLNICTYLEI